VPTEQTPAHGSQDADDGSGPKAFAPNSSVAQAMHAVAVSKLETFSLVNSEDAAKLSVPLSALRSLQRTLSAHKLKSDSKQFRKASTLQPLLQRCAPVGPESITDVALSVGWSPYLLARAAVARAMQCEGDKKALGSLMRNPSRISNCRLREDAQYAMAADAFVSPAVDAAKARVGALYERHLEALLDAVHLPYSSESSLRELGAAKTPDVLLNVPIGIVHPVTGEAVLVNWLDSKGLFGDSTTHMASVMPQAQAYANRYGPGIIVYWLGCEAALCDSGSSSSTAGEASQDIPPSTPLHGGQSSIVALPCFPLEYVLPGDSAVHQFKLLPLPAGCSEDEEPPAGVAGGDQG